jgi:predicted adenylyl cyclase CyaB
MPRNIEIKARVRDRRRLEQLAAGLSDAPAEVIRQEDTFYNVPHGRLKLRVFSAERGELIFYERPDTSGPKVSDYSIVPTDSPQALHALLAAALGVRTIVRKTRTLYMAGQTRIHVDEVEGLGDFVELEVVLRPGQSHIEGEGIAAGLMNALEISEIDLVEGAYADLASGR